MIQTALDEWILNDAIPFSLYPSSLNDAIDQVIASLDPSVELLGFGEPEFGTLEAILAAAAGPGLFIPTYRVRGLAASEIEPLPMGGEREEPDLLPADSSEPRRLYALAFLDKVGYSRGGPELP